MISKKHHTLQFYNFDKYISILERRKETEYSILIFPIFITLF